MLANDISQTIFLGKLFGILFELDDHLGAARGHLGWLDGESIGAGAEPGGGLSIWQVSARDHPDPLGYHEGRIKANPKLPNHIG